MDTEDVEGAKEEVKTEAEDEVMSTSLPLKLLYTIQNQKRELTTVISQKTIQIQQQKSRE